ncbi:hypothetical protein AYO45_04685 [Gammaproteobacteria bacterium SCGC AG-212-F23]|nr:hypothetical protein AYO45_04685 [Gammaproteobacteria bacterium SCGC AG-212-F23]
MEEVGIGVWSVIGKADRMSALGKTGQGLAFFPDQSCGKQLYLLPPDSQHSQTFTDLRSDPA